MAPTPQHGVAVQPRRTIRPGAYRGSFNTDRYWRELIRSTDSRAASTSKRRPSRTSSGNTQISKASASKMTSSKKTLGEAIDTISASQFSVSGTVTLLVGEDEQKMIAHGEHLARDSEYFAAAMKKEWVEGQTRTIRLTEECPDAMAHYLSFVYTGKLFTEDVDTVDGERTKPCYLLLVSLYVCGERFLNRRLQSAVVEQILRLTSMPDKDGKEWYPTGESVNIVYNGTPEGSPGRCLMVDLHVVMGATQWLDNELHIDFVTDVARALYERVMGLPFRKQPLTAEKYMHQF